MELFYSLLPVKTKIPLCTGEEHSFYRTPSGEYYSTGQHYLNRSTSYVSRGSWHPLSFHEPIREIFTGYHDPYLLTEKGVLYHYHCQESPWKLAPAPLPFQEVSIGYHHKLFLAETGVLYGEAWKAEGALGLPLRSTEGLCRIPFTELVIKVYAVGSFSVLLAQSGSCYATGYSCYNLLGDANVIPFFQMRWVKLPLEGVRVLSVGLLHTLALTKEGKCYGIGNNQFGELGDAPCNQWTLLPYSGIIHLHVGEHFTLLYNGKWFSLGALYLPWNNKIVIEIPDDVEQLCLFRDNLFIVQKGVYRAKGRNEYGELGVGHNFLCPEWTEINLPC